MIKKSRLDLSMLNGYALAILFALTVMILTSIIFLTLVIRIVAQRTP